VMGLDIFFREDIEHILLAARQAMLDAGGDGEFRRGFEAALIAVALATGIAVGKCDTQALLTQGDDDGL